MVEIINKRNRAVFEVETEEAVELIKNFGDLLETKDELPEEPKTETPVNPDEQKILGGEEEKTEPETKDELPEEPKTETPVVSRPINANNQPRKTEIVKN